MNEQKLDKIMDDSENVCVSVTSSNLFEDMSNGEIAILLKKYILNAFGPTSLESILIEVAIERLNNG
ncbi:MAG: hypothetical protein ACTSX6_08215 [Candidatus Heimdallarchaeaceae archaeon]